MCSQGRLKQSKSLWCWRMMMYSHWRLNKNENVWSLQFQIVFIYMFSVRTLVIVFVWNWIIWMTNCKYICICCVWNANMFPRLSTVFLGCTGISTFGMAFLNHGRTYSCLLVQRKHAVFLLFFSSFRLVFVAICGKCISLLGDWAFLLSARFWYSFCMRSGVSIVWPFFSRWKLVTFVGNNEFFIVQLLRGFFTLHHYSFYSVGFHLNLHY